MKPLYMWAGGKNKMIKQYLETPGIPTSGFDTFVEPFFGGGAMTIWVYENCPDVKRFVINDIKEEIVGIYKAIKTDVDNFIKRMEDLQSQYIPLDKAERKKWFYDLRTPYATNQHNWNTTDESATLYFLMKTAFNGIWQTTKRANGRFDTPFGLGNQKDTVYDKDNVLEWHKFLQKVDIHCGDWKDACDTVDECAFYFFDPPYRDSFTSYGEGFTDDDHIALIDYSKQMDANGNIVFYCNRADSADGFFDKHKGQLIDSYYGVNYTAGRRATEKDSETGEEKRTSKAATEILLHSKIEAQPEIFGNGLCEICIT